MGTSGCRVAAIDAAGRLQDESRAPLAAPIRRNGGVEQSPEAWWEALETALTALLARIPPQAVRALALDATSGTVLAMDRTGAPCGSALMYNDNRAVAEAKRIAAVAPADSAAHGTGSGLAKALWLLAHHDAQADHIATQAEWLTARLTGRPGRCDTNSALKLGWDAVAGRWPDWLAELGLGRARLPEVVAPGHPLGRLKPELVATWGLPPECEVVAGTTDSTAAILATGAGRIGDAITSLGSTLVTKVIASRPCFAPNYGVYSQPLGGHWLVGGGSNSGGAVLRRFFTPEQLQALSAQIDPRYPSGLDYYPLPGPGERFPVYDPQKPPRLTPRPADDVRFLHGLLEGIAAIEREAYRKLADLGAPRPSRLFTVGGGASNCTWSHIRAQLLKVEMVRPAHTEAAYGSALLAAGIASGRRSGYNLPSARSGLQRRECPYGQSRGRHSGMPPNITGSADRAPTKWQARKRIPARHCGG